LDNFIVNSTTTCRSHWYKTVSHCATWRCRLWGTFAINVAKNCPGAESTFGS